MKRIELHIECNTGENDLPEELQNLVGEIDSEYRPVKINIEHISYYYPGYDGNDSLMWIGGLIAVKESVDKIDQLINELEEWKALK